MLLEIKWVKFILSKKILILLGLKKEKYLILLIFIYLRKSN